MLDLLNGADTGELDEAGNAILMLLLSQLYLKYNVVPFLE